MMVHVSLSKARVRPEVVKIDGRIPKEAVFLLLKRHSVERFGIQFAGPECLAIMKLSAAAGRDEYWTDVTEISYHIWSDAFKKGTQGLKMPADRLLFKPASSSNGPLISGNTQSQPPQPATATASPIRLSNAPVKVHHSGSSNSSRGAARGGHRGRGNNPRGSGHSNRGAWSRKRLPNPPGYFPSTLHIGREVALVARTAAFMYI